MKILVLLFAALLVAGCGEKAASDSALRKLSKRPSNSAYSKTETASATKSTNRNHTAGGQRGCIIFRNK